MNGTGNGAGNGVAKRVRKPARRGMFILPSLFTAGNIAIGYYAITQSLQGSALEPHHFDYAALAIGAAIPFDALDGRIARMTNTTSDFGRELDSLADVITFGVAPSILAYTWGFRMLPLTMDPMLREKLIRVGALVCFLFLICGACRLARFNISSDAQPKNPGRPDRKYFVGMPIPAAAGFLAATVHISYGLPVRAWWYAMIWLGLVGLCGFLMVSTWRFWSGKEINFARSHPFQLVFLLAIVFYVMLFYSHVVFFGIGLTYVFSGIWARAAYGWSRRRRRRPVDNGIADDADAEPDSLRPL